MASDIIRVVRNGKAKKVTSVLTSPLLATFANNDATPDVSAASIFLCASGNSAPLVITDLDNPIVGAVVTIIGTNSTNYTRINKGGNFNMPEDLVLGQGDSAELYISADNSYTELSRNIVNRVRTIPANATTPDVAIGEIFVTSANSGATAITDLTNPRVGANIKIIGGSDTNASTIADSGNFALSASFNGQAKNVLNLFVNADNDYYETGRSINHA